MLQLFRSYQWSAAFIVFGVALLLRGLGLLLPIPSDVPAALGAGVGPWGQVLVSLQANSIVAWIAGSVAVSFVGFCAAFTLHDYRLGVAGTVPGLMAVLIASSLFSWLGFTPYLIVAMLLALAAQRIYGGYRHQGAALPVYDAGLIIGLATLFIPSALIFILWGTLALAQLRKLRFSELLSLLIGVATLPVIAGIYAFVFGDFVAFRQNLFAIRWQLPITSEWMENWPSIGILALLTGAAVGGLRLLTTRRPIQEQKANRMFYSMLGVGWIAILFTAVPLTSAYAYVLYPLAATLGIWLSELSRKQGRIIVSSLLTLLLGGYAFVYFTQAN